jgi:drug/metabolite transporter (DMT)-like permease
MTSTSARTNAIEAAAPGQAGIESRSQTSVVPPARWLPGMVILGMIWGSSFLFIKIGVSELHPFYVAWARVASGALALVIILLITRQRLPRDLRGWGHNAVVGVVGVAAPFSLFGYGEQRIPSILAGIWNSITPLVVLPLAVLAFRTEKLTRRRLIGLLLGLAGALIILGIWRSPGGAAISGQLMCLVAAACYGVSIPYTRKFLSPRSESGLVMSAAQLIVASVVLAVVAPLVSGVVPHPAQLSWQVIASVLTLGVLGTGIALLIHLRNIRMIGASAASMVTYIIPVFATVIGALVLGERIAWYQPIGAAIVLLGVAVAQGVGLRRVRRPARANP